MAKKNHLLKTLTKVDLPSNFLLTIQTLQLYFFIDHKNI